MLRVFTEGKDSSFIDIYLNFLGYFREIDFTVNNSAGWTKIHEIAPKIREYQDAGDKVVLIFDSDDVENGGGFVKRSGELKDLLEAEKLNVETFLFPNNVDDGDFESLIVQCASPSRNGVFDCFRNYELCVQGLNSQNETFKTPLRKSKFYAYFECINESESAKDRERKGRTYFFNDERYWNLSSPILSQLKDFLIDKLDS